MLALGTALFIAFATPRDQGVTLGGCERAAAYSERGGGQAMVVLQNGKLIYERYANGGAVNRRQLLASGSKSFVGLAAAAAVQDGLLRLDDRVAIPEWQRDPVKSKITYRQLLSLTSGLTPADAGTAIRGEGWKEVIAKPMVSAPGEKFAYGANQLIAFAYALELKLKSETFEAYLQRRLLAPIGVNLEWRLRSRDGKPQVGGGGFMTARDWTQIGEFVRFHGRWQNRQLVDPKTLDECFVGSAANATYGLTWWLRPDPKVPDASPAKMRPSFADPKVTWLPDGIVAACGAGDQRLYVIPSENLVVVRQGSLQSEFDDLPFLSCVLRGVEVAATPDERRPRRRLIRPRPRRGGGS